MLLKIENFFLKLLLCGYGFSSLANEASQDPLSTSPKPTWIEQYFPFILFGILLYFILIRPQQRKHKQHESFLSKIKKGDEILTAGGIYGRIEGLTDSFVILEVAEKVKIRVVRSQISSYASQVTKDKGKSKND